MKNLLILTGTSRAGKTSILESLMLSSKDAVEGDNKYTLKDLDLDVIGKYTFDGVVQGIDRIQGAQKIFDYITTEVEIKRSIMFDSWMLSRSRRILQDLIDWGCKNFGKVYIVKATPKFQNEKEFYNTDFEYVEKIYTRLKNVNEQNQKVVFKEIHTLGNDKEEKDVNELIREIFNLDFDFKLSLRFKRKSLKKRNKSLGLLKK